MTDVLLTHVDDRGVATLTLNRPEVHNAFDDKLIAELTEAIETLGGRDDIRAIVITGAGKSFSAGGDLAWMRACAEYDESQNAADAMRLARLMSVLDGVPKPTIARVNGHAFGGGVGLTACCDIVLASSRARFSLSEVRLGLVPAVISPYVIAAIGPRQARRYFLTAEAMDAGTALRIGLAHAVVDPDDLDDAVAQEIDHLLKGGPTALAEAKALIARLAPPVDEATRSDTAALIARLRVSAEGQEGLTAFLDKRAPDWLR